METIAKKIFHFHITKFPKENIFSFNINWEI